MTVIIKKCGGADTAPPPRVEQLVRRLLSTPLRRLIKRNVYRNTPQTA